MLGPVFVVFEKHSVIANSSQGVQAEYLKASRISKHRSMPGHELVQAASPVDKLMTGAKVKMVRIGQDYFRSAVLNLIDEYAFGTRRMVLQRFPYLIIFGKPRLAWRFCALAHGRRRPGYWRERVE